MAFCKRSRGGHFEADTRIRQGIDVAVGGDFRGAGSPIREVVGELELLDARHVYNTDIKLGAAQTGGTDVVVRVLLQRKKRELETERAIHHCDFLPFAVGILDMDKRFIRIEAFHQGGNAHIGTAAHALVTRGHGYALRWQQIAESPAGQ